MTFVTDTVEMAELLEHEAMEVEDMDEEKEQVSERLSDSKEPLEAPEVAASEGTAAKEQESISKSVSFLPRNKEELGRTIKTIQGAITGDILPRLHKCLASAVRMGPAGLCEPAEPVTWGGLLLGVSVPSSQHFIVSALINLRCLLLQPLYCFFYLQMTG